MRAPRSGEMFTPDSTGQQHQGRGFIGSPWLRTRSSEGSGILRLLHKSQQHFCSKPRGFWERPGRSVPGKEQALSELHPKHKLCAQQKAAQR